jgi:hypothetical protein
VIDLKKVVIALSLSVLTLTGTNHVMAEDSAYFEGYGIDIFDEKACNDEMNVFGYTEGGGDVESVKVYYELYRDGFYIDNFSNSDDDSYVTISMDHSGNDDSWGDDGPQWEVSSTHRVDDTDGDYIREYDYDSAYGLGCIDPI